MSNFMAIATVTATLKIMLESGIESDMDDTQVKVATTRPDPNAKDTNVAGVNLFLYQVTPNGSLRNASLPERSNGGQLINRPRTALDLHYLLSFHGDETKQEPQRMLGSTIRILNSQPMLTRDQITGTINDAAFDYLLNSDLADEIELVRFTPSSITLDEMSKLWSIFYQMPYELSVVYLASVVFIEGSESFRSAPMVQSYNAYSVPSLGPHIDQLLSQSAPGQPIVADQFILPGYQLVVQGERLRGDITTVSIGGVQVTPALNAVSNEQITVPLPATLRAGLQGVQVLQPFKIGTPAIAHNGLESNVVPLVLHPLIQAAVNVTATRTVNGVTLKDGTIHVNFNPRLGLRQRVVLELNQFGTPNGEIARAYTFTTRLPHPANPVNATDTDVLDIPFTGVIPGTYLVRVQVDGAESPLTLDAGVYDKPQVTI